MDFAAFEIICIDDSLLSPRSNLTCRFQNHPGMKVLFNHQTLWPSGDIPSRWPQTFRAARSTRFRQALDSEGKGPWVWGNHSPIKGSKVLNAEIASLIYPTLRTRTWHGLKQTILTVYCLSWKPLPKSIKNLLRPTLIWGLSVLRRSLRYI
jgi:hypothetical protein